MLTHHRREAKTYRLMTIAAVAVAVALALSAPYDLRELRMPDPWSYSFAIENFAQGRWAVNDAELAAARTRARLHGGQITQYVSIATNRWVFEKSPGYPLLAAPFQAIDQPRWANVFLALCAAWVLYRALTAWRGEAIAWAGTTIFSLSPLSVLGLHHSYMDTFASGAWLVIAGGLIALYNLPAGRPRRPGLSLFIAGGALGWAVVTRLPNVLIALPLITYLALSVWRRRSTVGRAGWLHLIVFGLGFGLALGALIAYNFAAFGQAFDSGYRYSFYRTDFVWGIDPASDPRTPDFLKEGTRVSAGSVIGAQLVQLAQPLTLGWPILPLAFAGMLLALWKRDAPLPAWLAALWVFVTYLPYAGIFYFGLTRELSTDFNRGWGFYVVDRYFFPAALPIVLMGASLLARWPNRIVVGFTLVYAVIGVWLSVQALAAL